jgi:hypothetical protein
LGQPLRRLNEEEEKQHMVT